MKKITIVSGLAGLGLLASVGAAEAMSASSYTAYKQLAESGIQKLSAPAFSDVEGLRSLTNQVIEVGVRGAREYAEQSPGSAKLMNLLVANVDNMRKMTIPEIEEAWHDGGFIEANGINYDFSASDTPDVNHVEAVVHAVTILLLLEEYEKSQDKDMLEQARDEFAEVIQNFPNS